MVGRALMLIYDSEYDDCHGSKERPDEETGFPPFPSAVCGPLCWLTSQEGIFFFNATGGGLF